MTEAKPVGARVTLGDGLHANNKRPSAAQVSLMKQALKGMPPSVVNAAVPSSIARVAAESGMRVLRPTLPEPRPIPFAKPNYATMHVMPSPNPVHEGNRLLRELLETERRKTAEQAERADRQQARADAAEERELQRDRRERRMLWLTVIGLLVTLMVGLAGLVVG